jgi:hypothetical protein
MLSPSQVNSARASYEALCTTPCNIERTYQVADDYGAQIDKWAPITSTLCFLEEDKIREVEIGGRVVKGRVWLLTLPAGTDVKDLDRVTIDGDITITLFQTNRAESIDFAVECEGLEL